METPRCVNSVHTPADHHVHSGRKHRHYMATISTIW